MEHTKYVPSFFCLRPIPILTNYRNFTTLFKSHEYELLINIMKEWANLNFIFIKRKETLNRDILKRI